MIGAFVCLSVPIFMTFFITDCLNDAPVLKRQYIEVPIEDGAGVSTDDKLHPALKETAVRQWCSMGPIIEESPHLCGIRTDESAREIVSRARAVSGLEENESLAVRETRQLRQEKNA